MAATTKKLYAMAAALGLLERGCEEEVTPRMRRVS